MAGFEIYDPLLRYLKRGHALWDPDPKTQPPVSIGDVGYIRSGGFYRLFNIHLPADDPSQPESLPDGFEHVEAAINRQHLTELLASTFREQSVRVTQLGAEASVPAGGVMPLSGQLSFRCSRQNGAVLACEDTDAKDAHNLLFYERYIVQNIETWHAFACHQELPLEMDDLILVTGCHLTTAWALAALSGSDGDASVELYAGLTGQAGISLTGRLAWQNLRNAQENRGPRARWRAPIDQSTARSRSQPVSSTSASTTFPDSLESDQKDQCIFIRGYRAKRRLKWLGFKLRAAAGPDNLPGSYNGDGESATSLNPTTPDGSSDEGSIEAYPVPGKSQIRIPTSKQEHQLLTELLDYILEHSTSEFAVAHDDHLIPYTESLTRVEDLRADLLRSQPAPEIMNDSPAYATLAFQTPARPDLDREVGPPAEGFRFRTTATKKKDSEAPSLETLTESVPAISLHSDVNVGWRHWEHEFDLKLEEAFKQSVAPAHEKTDITFTASPENNQASWGDERPLGYAKVAKMRAVLPENRSIQRVWSPSYVLFHVLFFVFVFFFFFFFLPASFLH